METPLRFWATGFMNKRYNPCCSFFHYGRSIFAQKNVTERPNKKRTGPKGLEIKVQLDKKGGRDKEA